MLVKLIDWRFEHNEHGKFVIHQNYLLLLVAVAVELAELVALALFGFVEWVAAAAVAPFAIETGKLI